MIFYRIKFKDGGYQSPSSVQTESDKNKALLNKKLLEKYEQLINDTSLYVIETVNITPRYGIRTGGLSFGPGDTYSFVSVNAAIMHETKRYIYTCQIDGEGQLTLFRGIQKHRRDQIGTVDFKTGEGLISA